MQFTPFETHLMPEIEFKQAELVVKILSVHYLSLHNESVELFYYDYQKHSPSVPITHPPYLL